MLQGTKAGLAGPKSTEQENETARVLGDHTEILKDQVSLLTKIEENTKAASDAALKDKGSGKGDGEEKGSLIDDALDLVDGKGKRKKTAKTGKATPKPKGAMGKAMSKLGGAGKAVAGKIGSLGAAGLKGISSLASSGTGMLSKGAELVSGGASAAGGALSKYGGAASKGLAVLGAGEAVYSGVSDLAAGKKVESMGDVVPEGWDKLNPFSWAMRGGMYGGEKANQSYAAVSDLAGGSGSVGGDIHSGVDKVSGLFGGSDKDVQKDATKKAEVDLIHKKISSKQVISSQLAAKAKSYGIQVPPNLIKDDKLKAPKAGPSNNGVGTGPKPLVSTAVAVPPADVKVTPTPTTAVAAPAPTAANAVSSKSADNAALAAAPPIISAPVVINAPTNSNTTQTTVYTPKAMPRNSDSSIRDFTRSRYSF